MYNISIGSIRFIQQKGFLRDIKDAMDTSTVVEDIKEKVEVKVEEVVAKVQEQVVELTDVALDKTQTVVEDTSKKVSDEVVAAVESNVVVQKIEELIDSNPQVKADVEKLEAAIVKEVDGRVFTCWCCCWWWSLKITRQNPKKLPATASPSTVVVPPLPNVQVPEWSPPTPPVVTSTKCCGKKSVA